MIAFIRSWPVVVGILMCVVSPASGEFGNELFKLTASDGEHWDHFGRGVAIDGKIAIVGAGLEDDAGDGAGSAYVFDVSTGHELFKLTASDAVADASFGSSVSISGNMAIVGGSNTGKAYVFNVATGQELRKVTASDTVAGDGFGRVVRINGNTAIVGAPHHDDAGNLAGAAYLFDVTTGQELFKLAPSDAAAGDLFGVSVGINGNLAIVGARQSARASQGPGALYVFDVTTGNELRKITASDAGPGDYFGGWSNDLSGNIAIVSTGGYKTHAAYIFDITTGQELRKLYVSDNLADLSGSVAISGNTAIIGARFYRADLNDPITGWGAGYLFDVATGEQLTKLIPTDAHKGQVFGDAVAIDSNTAIVGASFGDKGTVKDTGSAYLFDVLRGPALPGDFNTDSTVDAADYIAWRRGLGTTYTQADYNTWRANFGRSADGATAGLPSSANPAVPEPCVAWLVLVALALASAAMRTCPHRTVEHGSTATAVRGAITPRTPLAQNDGRTRVLGVSLAAPSSKTKCNLLTTNACRDSVREVINTAKR